MRIVVVLGAGASLAQAAPPAGQDAMPMPPTDATFFERVSQLKIKAGPELTQRAIELLGMNPFLAVEAGARPGMEEFFKDLFYDYVSDEENTEAQIAYRQLVSIYASVIRRTTNSIAMRGARGPIRRLLRAATARHNDLTVVTFNHDLIVENVLHASPELRDRWCLRHGYGHFAVNRRFTLSTKAEGFPDPHECCRDRPIRILKLHGSLNWFLDADSPEAERAILRGDRTSGQSVLITRRREIPATFRHAGKPGRPLVVPPIYAKQPFLESFMRPVWRDATEALRECDRVVFFGYSMPPTDVEAEKLFQRSLAANASLRWADLVNPDPNAASRFAVALPRLPLRRYPTLGAFIQSKDVS